MVSKYEKQAEFYLENIANSIGLNLTISNDGNNHFIRDYDGHTFGHGETMSNLYSSIFLCAEILSMQKRKMEIKE
jgi:hypothetical protein|tara:strand:+ start:640 stop:864 length:225 start_codon:yes stop_codon:yes gene_type:complete